MAKSIFERLGGEYEQQEDYLIFWSIGMNVENPQKKF